MKTVSVVAAALCLAALVKEIVLYSRAYILKFICCHFIE